MNEPVPGQGAEYRRAQQLAAALHAAAAKGPKGRSEGRSGGRSRERGDLPDRMCAAAVGALGAQGSTLCAVFAPGMSVPVGVSDPVAARAEELQFSAGEGPCWQAHATGQVVVAELPGAGGAYQRWPAYTLALQREVGYAAVVAVPLRLALGLDLVFTVYGPWSVTERWWQQAPVVVRALQEVLEEASCPAAGGPVWLDSASTLRRGAVWVAEAVLVQQDPSLDAAGALRALRAFAVVEGMTVDAAAAALVQGGLSARQVLGRW